MRKGGGVAAQGCSRGGYVVATWWLRGGYVVVTWWLRGGHAAQGCSRGSPNTDVLRSWSTVPRTRGPRGGYVVVTRRGRTWNMVPISMQISLVCE